MVKVRCILEFEFSNGKKRLMSNDVNWIEEWCVDNKVKINRMIYWDDRYAKTRRYK